MFSSRWITWFTLLALCLTPYNKWDHSRADQRITPTPEPSAVSSPTQAIMPSTASSALANPCSNITAANTLIASIADYRSALSLLAFSADGRLVVYRWGDGAGYGDYNYPDKLFINGWVPITVGLNGTETNGDSAIPSISYDGHYITYESIASNLVVSDTNNTWDIFFYDRLSAQTERISVASDGSQANGPSSDAVISADGRFVAFSSEATNLVSGDTNGVKDIFLHDRLTGDIWLVSQAPDGSPANGGSGIPAISADGTFVAYDSSASNLVDSDTNQTRDIFLYNRLTGETSLISVSTDGSQGNRDSGYARLSANGRFTIFSSEATNLVSSDLNGVRDIFVRDRLSGETRRVSVASDGTEANNISEGLNLSADGHFVIFSSWASNLVEDDTNEFSDIFVHDLQSHSTSRVSITSSGAQSGGPSFEPFISADGRYLAFSSGGNLTGDGYYDSLHWYIFVRDRGPQGQTVEARFSAEPRAGISPLTVTFTNQSYGNLTSTLWNFGDGITSTLHSPTHTYTMSGVYTITLTASGIDMQNIMTCRSYVTAYEQLGSLARVSLSSAGVQTNDISQFSAVSADGRFVVFDSKASNLVSGDTNGVNDIFVLDRQSGETNGVNDIFVLDRQSGETRRVSVAADGTQGDEESFDPAISADGRFVAFASYATNLVSYHTNGASQIFVHDLQSGETVLASVSSNGVQGDSASIFPSISADGRFVAFASMAFNLTDDGDSLEILDVFVHDLQNGETRRASVASYLSLAQNTSSNPSISGDGHLVAFESRAENLVGGDTNWFQDIFVYDPTSNEMRRVSVSSDGLQANGDSFTPTISLDGRFVAFESAASNLVAGDTNGYNDIFVHDLQSRETRRVSLSSNGSQANGWSGHPSISAEGRYVTFSSRADNLVGGDTNDVADIFVHDCFTGRTRRASLASEGEQGNGNSDWPAISADGRIISFQSTSTTLVSNDTNGQADIFLHDWEFQASPAVQASFNVEPKIGAIPLTITFTDHSYGDLTSSLWNFGDGITSSLRSQTHTYTSSGVYTVTLSVRGVNTENTLTCRGCITVYDHLGVLTRVSPAVTRDNINDTPQLSTISADGRYVAFSSTASNLVNGDTNDSPDIFIRDRLSGEIRRISVTSNGTQANSSSTDPAISANGRFVTFASDSSNLVAGDNNYTTDIYLHDLQNGETHRISQAPDGTSPNGNSAAPAISAGGRFVVFDSMASNLVSSDNNKKWDIFVHDRKNGETQLVSIASDGTQGDGSSTFPAISADGQLVVFGSRATNLVISDTNGKRDIFVHNMLSGETRRVSVASDGTQGNDDSFYPDISLDGRFVIFESAASNLVAKDTNSASDVFIHDLHTGETLRVSLASNRSQGNGASGHPSISVDGRLIAFTSSANNLAVSDTNDLPDIFIRDRLTGKTRRASLASDGRQANGDSDWPALSFDGRFVSFQSAARNLLSDATDIYKDIFLNDWGTPTPTNVQAGFSASPLAGVAPLTVTFTNRTSCYFTSSLWLFGDGDASMLTSPTHTYTTPGVYTVTLLVSSPDGMDILTRLAYIGVQYDHPYYLPLVTR